MQDDPRHATGRVSVSLENGEPSYEIVANSAYDFIASEALPDVRPGLIYHGSLAVRNSASKEALGVLKSGTDASIFVDVNLRAPWWRRDSTLELLMGANWVKLNRDELALLGDGCTDLLGAAQQFRDAQDLEGLVVTLGEDGAIAVAANQEPVRISPPERIVKVVDAVGAGDAFASVIILGLRQGWPLATTLERAQDFASELVQRQGATVSDRELYQSRCQQWESTR